MRGDTGGAQHDLLDLAGEHVHTAQDEHVVTPPGDLLDAAEGRTGRPRQQPGEIPRAVADDGHRLARERGEDQLAALALGHHRVRHRVDDLRQEVVLPHMQPVLGLHALLGDAGAHHLRQPVDVHGVQIEPLLDLAAHLLRPRLGAEDAHAQGGGARVDALAFELVEQGEHVGRGDHDDLGPEVLDDPHLARGHPARGGDDRAAGPLGAVVRAETAGEQAVPVGDMHLVPRAAAGGADRAGDEVRPDGEVVLGVPDHRGAPGGPAGGVDAAHLGHGDGEHPEGVGVPQIRLGGEREPRDVLQGAAVLGGDTGRVELPAVQLHMVVRAAQGGPQPRELEVAQFLPGHALGLVPQLRRERPAAPGPGGRRGRGLAAHGASSVRTPAPVSCGAGARVLPTVRLRPRNSAISSSPRRTLTSYRPLRP